ncbi:hypothetical protein PQX77_019893 [Marasmius sp. AFHP31]|nr:hypothetical protein PQX77_019893 [Marasmius sp. AFHP31]
MAQESSSATSGSSASVHGGHHEGNGRRRNLETMRFLDLEAEVDRDEEDSDDDELTADFVVADDDTDKPLGFSHCALNVQIQREDDTSRYDAMKDVTLGLDSNLPTRRIAHNDQLPPATALWAVHCKPRKEFQVISYAIQHALERQASDILSLHYRHDGDGLLYLDTNNPSAAAKILKDCAFVLHLRDSHHHGVKMQRLDIMESIRSLRFPSHLFDPGDWVRVFNPRFGLVAPTTGTTKKATYPPSSNSDSPNPQSPILPPKRKQLQRSYYHTSLAIVQGVDSRGGATILLVLQLESEMVRNGAKALLGAALGTPLLLRSKMGVPIQRVAEFAGTKVEHGLRVETIEANRLAHLSEPPSLREVKLFIASAHPHVMVSFPRVKEWVFEVGEKVCGPTGHFLGLVQEVTENRLGVKITRWLSEQSQTNAGEITCMGWLAFKQWTPGDYVQHTTGQEGFIIGKRDPQGDSDILLFWNRGEEGAMPYAAHRNTLRAASTTKLEDVLHRRRENVTMEALRLSNVSRDMIIKTMSALNQTRGFDANLMTPEQTDKALEVTKTFGNLWKLWNVLVWKGIHRGHFHVLDVIVSKQTKSGLKLQLRTDIVNAAGVPILVDYDYVVDADLLLPLHIIKKPPFNLRPPEGYTHPGIAGLLQRRVQLHERKKLDPPPPPFTPRGLTPPVETPPPTDPSPSTEPSSSTENSIWSPTDPGESSALVSALSTFVALVWWTSCHQSQHEFYDLDADVANLVFFQVELSGCIPDLKNKKYTNNPKSKHWLSLYFWQVGDRRTLTVDWNRIKGRLPLEIVVHPHRPLKNTQLPLIVTRGDMKNQVVTKVAGVGTDVFVIPVAVWSGEVAKDADPVKVPLADCCVVQLRKAAQDKWRDFNVADWANTRKARSLT